MMSSRWNGSAGLWRQQGRSEGDANAFQAPGRHQLPGAFHVGPFSRGRSLPGREKTECALVDNRSSFGYALRCNAFPTQGGRQAEGPGKDQEVITIPLVKKITELFLILFASAALVKTGVFKADYSKVLSRISLYFVTPCVIFNSFQKELTPEIQQGLLIVTALAVGFQLLFYLIAEVLRRVWKATEVERASIIFTNAGNLIIPLVGYVLGEDWVIYVSGYILVFNVMFWTVGIRMFDSRTSVSIRKILLNPNILAVLAGLLMLFTGLPLPEPAAIAFRDVASMIGPLSMMITGMIVGSMKFRDMFANRRIYGVILFRMVLCSGTAVLCAALSGIAGRIPSGQWIVMIPLLSAIAPSASNINQVAILYNKDAKYASAINILTTLSCILTIPLWILLYEAIV